jgi:trans-aconitate 2-methyltransferase
MSADGGDHAVRWDPQQYARFADERARPFLDLLARVGATAPRRVVDLGCGTGTLTGLLSRRWPDARVQGIDSSPEMITQASRSGSATVTFGLGDIDTWTPSDDTDVVISNAALQWVPRHVELLRSWAGSLTPGGWLAFQVPANFDAPSHTLLRRLVASPRWAPRLSGALRHHDAVREPGEYAELLLDAGLAIDVWQTTYVHRLSGDDPVLSWLRGTGLRPVLARLDDAEAAKFEREFAPLLRAAYPATPGGTLFPFRRTFAVGHRHHTS